MPIGKLKLIVIFFVVILSGGALIIHHEHSIAQQRQLAQQQRAEALAKAAYQHWVGGPPVKTSGYEQFGQFADPTAAPPTVKP